METIKKIIHQVSWQMGSKILTAASTIATLSFVTRSFGETGTGVYTLALTYLAFFYLAADLGLNGFYLSSYRDDPLLPNKLFNFRLIWSFLLILIALGLLPFLPFSTTPFILTVIIGATSILFNGFYNSANFVFQHELAYSKSSIALAAGSLMSLAVAVVFYTLRMPVYIFVLAPLAGWMLTAFLCWIFVKRYYQIKLAKIDLMFPVETLKIAWPVAATLVINTLYFRIDAFILSSTQSFAVTGAYNLAYAVFQNLLVIPAFIMNGYYPLMLRSLRENTYQFYLHLKNAVFIMLGLGIVGAVGLFVFSGIFIDLLTGGGFKDSVVTLHILTTSLPAFFLSALLMWVLMAKKMYRHLLAVYLIALIFNFSANWYLIPLYSYQAAAWVTVGGEYLILVLQLFTLYRHRS